MNRLLGLDLLRGLCALGVALHHLCYWLGGPPLVNQGMYLVYAFFVLSGVSMVLAYSDKIHSDAGLLQYFFGRLSRLMPLFLAITAFYGYLQLHEGNFSLYSFGKLFINSFLIYGLGNPGQFGVIEGAWYVGIDFVFMFLMPMMLVLARSRLAWFCGILLLLGSQIYIQLIFASGDLKENWVSYTQILSFAHYYFFGLMIGHAIKNNKLTLNPSLMNLAFWGLFLFISLWSPQYTEEALLGYYGKILPIATILLVYCAGYVYIPAILTPIVRFMGDTSYGLFLCHPLVFYFILRILYIAPENNLHYGAVVLIGAYITAFLSLKYYELPIKDWLKGKIAVYFHG